MWPRLTWVTRLSALPADDAVILERVDGLTEAPRPVPEEPPVREFLAAAAISAVIIGLMLGVA